MPIYHHSFYLCGALQVHVFSSVLALECGYVRWIQAYNCAISAPIHCFARPYALVIEKRVGLAGFCERWFLYWVGEFHLFLPSLITGIATKRAIPIDMKTDITLAVASYSLLNANPVAMCRKLVGSINVA